MFSPPLAIGACRIIAPVAPLPAPIWGEPLYVLAAVAACGMPAGGRGSGVHWLALKLQSIQTGKNTG